MFFFANDLIDTPFWTLSNIFFSAFFAFITYFYLRHNSSPVVNYIVNNRILLFRKNTWFSDSKNIEYLKKNISDNESWFVVVWSTLLLRWAKARASYTTNSWIYTTNHKRIAINYFIFVLVAGTAGMSLASVIRLEFAYPGVGILAGDRDRKSVVPNTKQRIHPIVQLHSILQWGQISQWGQLTTIQNHNNSVH